MFQQRCVYLAFGYAGLERAFEPNTPLQFKPVHLATNWACRAFLGLLLREREWTSAECRRCKRMFSTSVDMGSSKYGFETCISHFVSNVRGNEGTPDTLIAKAEMNGGRHA